MKTLALIFTIILACPTISFTQTFCGIRKGEAHIPNSRTWNTLKARFKVKEQPRHWEDKKAKYWRNTLSNSAPPGADGAIIAAANSWNASSFQGDDDFDFKSQGRVGVPAIGMMVRTSFHSKGLLNQTTLLWQGHITRRQRGDVRIASKM